MFFLSVIIPSHYRSQQLKNCLESILSQKVNGKIEIVTAINSDDSDSLDIIHSLTRPTNVDLKIIKVSKASVNAKRNEGWRHSEGDWVHFLDDDCQLPDPYFYSRVIDFISNNKVNYFGGHYQSQIIDKNLVSHFYNWWSKTWLKLHKGKVLLGGNFFTNRSIEVHFDEDIEYGGAETEFFIRQPHLYWHLNEALFVHHLPNVTLSNLISKIFRQNLGPKVEIKFIQALKIFLRELLQKPLFTLSAALIFMALILHRTIHSVIVLGKSFASDSER